MTSYFLLIHSRNECGGSILKNTVKKVFRESQKSILCKRIFIYLFIFIIPDSVFNSVSVV